MYLLYISSICSKIVYLVYLVKYNSSFFFHQPLFLTMIPNRSNYSIIDRFVLLSESFQILSSKNELKSCVLRMLI